MFRNDDERKHLRHELSEANLKISKLDRRLHNIEQTLKNENIEEYRPGVVGISPTLGGPLPIVQHLGDTVVWLNRLLEYLDLDVEYSATRLTKRKRQ